MAKIDLTSPEWCELVFTDRNKEYGAYRMREESPRRHNWAVLIVLLVALIGFSIPKLVEFATPEKKEVMTEVTVLSKLDEAEVKDQEVRPVEPLAPPPPALKSSIDKERRRSP